MNVEDESYAVPPPNTPGGVAYLLYFGLDIEHVPHSRPWLDVRPILERHGFRVGQVVGDTDGHGGWDRGVPYSPASVLSSLYRHLGIDPTTTLPDHAGRPLPMPDDVAPVRELHG